MRHSSQRLAGIALEQRDPTLLHLLLQILIRCLFSKIRKQLFEPPIFREVVPEV